VDDRARALGRGSRRRRPRRGARAHARARLREEDAGAALERGKKPVFSDDKRALGDKIEALLRDAGYPWKYAAAMAKRMFKIDALEFATPAQLHSVVAALEYDRQRRNRRGR
jgi:hypothetical protein